MQPTVVFDAFKFPWANPAHYFHGQLPQPRRRHRSPHWLRCSSSERKGTNAVRQLEKKTENLALIGALCDPLWGSWRASPTWAPSLLVFPTVRTPRRRVGWIVLESFGLVWFTFQIGTQDLKYTPLAKTLPRCKRFNNAVNPKTPRNETLLPFLGSEAQQKQRPMAPMFFGQAAFQPCRGQWWSGWPQNSFGWSCAGWLLLDQPSSWSRASRTIGNSPQPISCIPALLAGLHRSGFLKLSRLEKISPVEESVADIELSWKELKRINYIY